MSKQLPCAGKAFGCTEMITQRGVIYCNICIENKKNNSKAKREMELDDIINKNNALEERIKNFIKNEEQFKIQIEQYQNKIKELETDAESMTDYASSDYSSHLEKENERITSLLSKYIEENEKLIKEKSLYERTFEQTKLDINKMKIEQEKLISKYMTLSNENEKLQKENEDLIKIQENFSCRVSNFKDKLQKTVMQVEEIKRVNPVENGDNSDQNRNDCDDKVLHDKVLCDKILCDKPNSEKFERVNEGLYLNLNDGNGKKFKKKKKK